jgi:hypothetical protein
MVVLSFRSVCRKSPCTHRCAVTRSEVNVIGPSIVPAIPEAASQSSGNALLRLEGVESHLRNLARMLAVVCVEQL